MCDAKWLAQLGNSRAGRALQDHLSCVEDILKTEGRDAAIQCCVENRRSFLYAVVRNAQRKVAPPCNLPRKYPKYIAIVNLSGSRMILHSDNDALMRRLCSRSTCLHSQDLKLQLQQFSSWVDTQQREATPSKEAFVLINFQLPWQAGICGIFWEINSVAFERGASETTISDRVRSLSSMSPCVFRGKSSLSDLKSMLCTDDSTIQPMGSRQMKAFNENYTTTCVDHADVDDDIHSGRDHRSDDLLRAAMQQRRETIKELAETRSQLSDVRAGAATAAAAANELMEKRLSMTEAEAERDLKLVNGALRERTAELDGMRPTMGALLKEQAESKRAHEKLEGQFEKFRNRADAQNKLANTASTRLSCEKSDLEYKLIAQRESHRQAVGDLAKTHNRALADVRKQVVGLEEKLKSNERLMDQLAENNDRKNTELMAAATHTGRLVAEMDALRKELRARECAPLLPAARSVSCTTDTIGTLTHQCAITQTEQARVFPEDLPSWVGVRMIRDSDELTPGTHKCNSSPTHDEEEHTVSSTGSTSSNTNQACMYQEPHHSYQQPHGFYHDVDIMPSCHAHAALSAVQWLVQWTHGCEALMQQPQYHPNHYVQKHHSTHPAPFYDAYNHTVPRGANHHPPPHMYRHR